MGVIITELTNKSTNEIKDNDTKLALTFHLMPFMKNDAWSACVLSEIE